MVPPSQRYAANGAGIHTLDSAHNKAYTSVSFNDDTLALAERAKGGQITALSSSLLLTKNVSPPSEPRPNQARKVA